MKNQKTTVQGASGSYLTLIAENVKNLELMSVEIQQKYYARHGGIVQLMAIHNSLCDTALDLTKANERAINNACSVLEHEVRQRNDGLNNFLELEFANATKKGKKPRKNSTKKASKARKNSVKKARSK